MRKIDKSNLIVSEFKKELKEFVAVNNKHPDYNKDTKFKNKHYSSVFFNLLGCQKGLCAYSEAKISSINFLSNENWLDSFFIGKIPNGIDGDIEHFNPDIKENEAWEWSNLFVVSTYINRKIKGRNKVNTIFKPDNFDYEPSKYMTFNFNTQIFVPLPKLEFENIEMFNNVKEMIKFLGLNSETVKSRRTDMLLDFKKDIENKCKTIEYIEKNNLHEFFTAFEMCKSSFHK